MRILLGVSGGVAAYKAVLLLRLLREQGHQVRVVPTASALRFVGAPTFEALSGEKVSTEVFDDVPQVAHVALGQGADLVIVAPATADLLARAAAGRADDLLTSTLLTVSCPVVMAPAMHTEMWQHPATVANVATLRSRGVHVIEPASGRLTGKDSGPGRLPEPEDIARVALEVAARGVAPVAAQDLSGLRVVVSAGGTREPIDPVRFIGNLSSGRQGIALACAAQDRGADVTLVGANLTEPVGDVADVVRVGSTAELREAMRSLAPEADVLVMTAAVADFRPARTPSSKIKKVPGQGPAPIELVENPDILAELARERERPGQVVVGFAAETGDDTGDVWHHGRAKARRKGADLLVINPVGHGKGFGTDTNEVVIVDAEGETVASAQGSKREVADAVWDTVLKVRPPIAPTTD
ncbi:bifunctional phosphopantothenoylcysteine decarboxylase/phosphopantothenate--cysteine ligase CoaBC [Oerskovia turbata]|uniref:Coenzyme A biosynthesis bifunctional protein CoaBC n=1 Tax=Oerskovia turbata TaxID=1713 RepID=A0A4Q1KYM5_9CELL|nr:bifunctional phosphopantothenoylcysteine decarboxylase/phosphopantothenate--cysteine ligase CoaBC [Oerskovia turbata]RXR24821.1 bifunctional phosphopantothenoylcysteine decarboxylase/phosphopantothenate--cysteine ligase CoaBC [Oerskovia turbata]RXR34975.1 bifunctional phosphopantothenoylcysteine decarboxylase/phosphopantothenate--cysteine ligase CoaBC [Oerskovia turbata]TGJ97036.1 bifunctional phosphopantothenoylcysteine decarboxylase/phosphopantothenate--cysteine ligase CoaBC [Actinotalea fe